MYAEQIKSLSHELGLWSVSYIAKKERHTACHMKKLSGCFRMANETHNCCGGLYQVPCNEEKEVINRDKRTAVDKQPKVSFI